MGDCEQLCAKYSKKDIPSHPLETLESLADCKGLSYCHREFALYMDSVDPLSLLRNDFFYPKMKDLGSADLSLVNGEEDCVYLCGHSLGLQPRGLKAYLDKELDKWAKSGVYGHFQGDMPWAHSDEYLDKDMATLVGAKEGEIAMMNALSINMHLAFISFYRPTETRYKILIESKAFPSDIHMVVSQIELHGLKHEDCLLEIAPRKDEDIQRMEDILDLIEREGSSIAVIFLSGVQYYTGQLFDMAAITAAGHKQGCYVGFDLAHAAGNVDLHLHDWGVDFACWCTYKYLNSGAGSMGAFFLHERHSRNDFPKLLGWWSHESKSRFCMDKELKLSPGAHGYRVSNPSILLSCSVRASLDVFCKTSMSAIRSKSLLLTSYLRTRITEAFRDDEELGLVILTPSDPKQHGSQLSLRFKVPAKPIYDELSKRGVVCDVREPDVIRLAPSPLYGSFTDVHRFMEYFVQAVKVVLSTRS